jgi:hypothetical protein
MQRFSVLLKKVGYYAAPAYAPPPDLVLTPERWSASTRGGMKQCSIVAAGSAQSLVYLAGWLGDRLEIYNELGDLVWYGVLWDLEINIGNVIYSSSLENVYNRVAVTYPFTLADGSVESRTTEWKEDANSVARYGKRELLYGMPEMFNQAPDTVRDTLLERFRAVAPAIQTSAGGETSATLVGQGIWQKANSVYFKNPDGLLEHTDESASTRLGQYFTSTLISFGEATPGGDKDEMYIATGNFPAMQKDDNFTISGSASNNETFQLDHQDQPNQISITGSFTSEAAGATVKFSNGDHISYDMIAQSFKLKSTWVVTHVAVKCRKVGNPTDNFRIGIYPDAVGGVPGTALTSLEVAGSTLYTELEWMEFALTTPVTLLAGVVYHLGIRRTGAAAYDNGYEIALDETAAYVDGRAIFWTGTQWVEGNPAPPADMPFRLIGEIDSTEQMSKALAVVDDFTQVLFQVDSNVPIRPFMAEERTVSDVMAELLDTGTSTGARLVAYTMPDGTVIIGTEVPSSYGDPYLMLGADGKLRYPTGGFVPAGRLIYGQTIDMEGLLLFDSLGIRGIKGSGIYISESEYDSQSETLSVQSEGSLDPWKVLTASRG